LFIVADVSVINIDRRRRQPSSWLSLRPPSSTSAIVAAVDAVNIGHRHGHCHRQRQRGHSDGSGSY
jgi:hypothetical protein